MRRSLCVISALLACVGACGKSEKSCKTEADALGKLLREAPHEPALFLLAGRHLVTRTDLPAQKLPQAPSIDIRKSEIAYQGRLMASRDELQEMLEVTRRYVAERPGVEPDLIYFVIDDDATWDQVVLAFDAAEAVGMARPTFVFDASTKLTPPPRTALDVELDKLRADPDPDAAEKASKLAKMISDRIASCKSLQKVFGQIAAVESGSKADILIEGLPDALVACDCNVDMPQLRSVLWRLLVNERAVRVFGFAPGVRDQTIALPASTSWAEASKQLAPPLRGAKLVVQ